MKERILNLLPRRIYLELKRREFKHVHPDRFDRMQELRQGMTHQGYSYKPFDDLQSIFVHIPKCAGVSVSKTLFGGLAGGHMTLDGYLNVFEPQCILNYFKFSIVRNPWDRLVSAYFFLKNGGFNDDDKQWFNMELGNLPSFESFVNNWLNRTNIWKCQHFQPQYHYMIEKREKVKLDFVGFMENIEGDFQYIADRIGVKRNLANSNSGAHDSYLGYYDETTRKIVADVYAEDIKMLGYNFDNSNIARQVAERTAGKRYSLRDATI